MIYLKPAPYETPNAREYNLLVTNLNPADVDYYTMSAQGLIHVAPGFHSEVTQLSDWLHHCTLFKIFSKSRLFKLWRASKAIYFWRESVRQKRYAAKRSLLHRRMFKAKSSYCVPLIQVRLF